MEDNHNKLTDEILAAFLDGNVSESEMQEVLSSIQKDETAAEIVSLSQKIDSEIELGSQRILPMSALAAANPLNLCSFDCETFILQHLDINIDHWSLLETAKANNWLREDGTSLHHVGRLLELKGLFVERKYDASIQDLEKALDVDKQVVAVVDRNLLGESDSGENTVAPSYHAIYITNVDEDGDVEYLNLDTLEEEFIEKDIFLDAWKCSSNYLVTATESNGGYNPQPIDVEEIKLDADLEELTEAIAENAHDIWARARMDEGWIYGRVRDDATKRHPDLVPYAQLPESEKEYDRLMAMNTLRLVRRLGYDIINRIKD